jgi:hypothetical protein
MTHILYRLVVLLSEFDASVDECRMSVSTRVGYPQNSRDFKFLRPWS